MGSLASLRKSVLKMDQEELLEHIRHIRRDRKIQRNPKKAKREKREGKKTVDKLKLILSKMSPSEQEAFLKELEGAPE